MDSHYPAPARPMQGMIGLRKLLARCNLYARSMSKTAWRAADADVLMQASKVISAAVAHSLALAGDTVSAPGLRVLVMLDASGPLNLSAVASGLGVNPSTASRTCDRLVVDGLVDRRDQVDDRRQVALSLTDKGAALLDDVMRERQAALTRVVESMPSGERLKLLDGLAGFVAAAAALGSEEEPTGGHGASIRWLV